MKFMVKRTYPHQYLYLLPLDFLGCKHVIDTDIEGLTPELAVPPLGAGRGHIAGPRPRAEQLGAALAAETDGALRRDNGAVSHQPRVTPSLCTTNKCSLNGFPCELHSNT